jgi:hypothetical protein
MRKENAGKQNYLPKELLQMARTQVLAATDREIVTAIIVQISIRISKQPIPAAW